MTPPTRPDATAQARQLARLRKALQQIADADAENCACDHGEECCARMGVTCAYCSASAALKEPR